ncbi:M20/M25/M40 family metallo-hydrolase [Streptomyces sp. NPDC051322]|uniref:M20/M25/M40 family metallo-hydrolase n=1 Tax=Streptomyces sp. NPDC051322 TaxID=3154645 RepID=UPI00344CD71C
MPHEAIPVDRYEAALPAIIDEIGRLVRTESPSADLTAVARSAEAVATIAAPYLGAAPDVITVDGHTHLRWRLGSGPRRVLLLGHHDTVWPVGSLTAHPFTVRDGVLRGPGCFDMKAGLVMAFHAIAALGAVALDGVTLLVTGDEELGSPSSRELIESEAAGCAAALVLEASADGGALKTERKGVSQYEIRVGGRAAHAGLEPERGVNAAIETAHQILVVAALSGIDAGTTVTPTLLSAGTTTNTVPAHGRFSVDVRVRDVAEQMRVDTALHGLRPVLDGATVQVTGGPNRPPLTPAASEALYRRARQLAGELGLGPDPGSRLRPSSGYPISAAAVGGASDGNFTAGIGIPTLDGLGAVGGGAHAADEHVLVAELPRRTALLAALIGDLLAASPLTARDSDAKTIGGNT